MRFEKQDPNLQRKEKSRLVKLNIKVIVICFLLGVLSSIIIDEKLTFIGDAVLDISIAAAVVFLIWVFG